MARRRDAKGTLGSHDASAQGANRSKKGEVGVDACTDDATERRTISGAFNAPVRPEGLNSRNSMHRRLSALSQHDLFWLAVGVFILRMIWFFLTNDSPHAPNRGKSHTTK